MFQLFNKLWIINEKKKLALSDSTDSSQMTGSEPLIKNSNDSQAYWKFRKL